MRSIIKKSEKPRRGIIVIKSGRPAIGKTLDWKEAGESFRRLRENKAR